MTGQGQTTTPPRTDKPLRLDTLASAVALQPFPAVSHSIGRLKPLINIPRIEALQITEVRGPAASMRRDALFRRLLVLADTFAVVGALVLTLALSPNSLRVTWVSLAGIPIVLLVAKLSGLYDRDEMLIHKTTLDEVPKLVQMATLVAVVAWIADGLIPNGVLKPGALLLWAWLTALLIVARACARSLALRIAPAERCLFIGDEVSAETIRSKLTEHRGLKAEVIAHLDLDKVSSWSTDSFSEARLAEIQDLAQTLDVHRAIIAPRSVDGGEMLNLVRTLKAVGVRVSVLPRLLEVVDSSVVFDDLHGVTVMSVRRFDLTRSSAAFKRAFDLFGASLGLLVGSPLLLVVAVAIKLDSRRARCSFVRCGWAGVGHRFQMLKFRTMVPEAEAMKDSLRHRNEAKEGAVQDR